MKFIDHKRRDNTDAHAIDRQLRKRSHGRPEVVFHIGIPFAIHSRLC